MRGRELRAARRDVALIFQQFNLIRRLTRAPERPRRAAGPRADVARRSLRRFTPRRPPARAALPGHRRACSTKAYAARRPALGRPAAARGDRAGARPGRQGHPGRRAGRQPRSRVVGHRARLAAAAAATGVAVVASLHQVHLATRLRRPHRGAARRARGRGRAGRAPRRARDRADLRAERRRCTRARCAPARVDAEWDAGELGCGELVLELRTRMQAMAPGAGAAARSRCDPGAPGRHPGLVPDDRPHAARQHHHPVYLIRRKET